MGGSRREVSLLKESRSLMKDPTKEGDFLKSTFPEVLDEGFKRVTPPRATSHRFGRSEYVAGSGRRMFAQLREE